MSAVSVKDHLYDLLNSAANVQEAITVTENVILPVLENTEGFWQEATYCYKAAEIANRIGRELGWHDCEVHWRTAQKIALVRERLARIEARYHFLQAEHVRECREEADRRQAVLKRTAEKMAALTWDTVEV